MSPAKCRPFCSSVIVLTNEAPSYYSRKCDVLFAYFNYHIMGKQVMKQPDNTVVVILYNNDVIMGAVASQITSLTSVYSIYYSGADQRKHHSSASLAFVRGIHRGPVNSPHKWPVTRKMFPFDDVIMQFPYQILKAVGLITFIVTVTVNATTLFLLNTNIVKRHFHA